VDVHGGGKVSAVCSNHPSGVEEMVPDRTIDKKQGQPREENAGRQARDLGDVDTTDATPEEHTPGDRTCTEKGSAGWGQIAKGNQCRNDGEEPEDHRATICKKIAVPDALWQALLQTVTIDVSGQKAASQNYERGIGRPSIHPEQEISLSTEVGALRLRERLKQTT
jgi:hypothetical protein